METRKVKDAKDLETGEKIYLKGHAKATYMSDGITVEDAINEFNVVAVDAGSEIEDLEEEYATIGYVDNAISNIESSGGGSNVDLTNYATKTYVNDTVEDAIEDLNISSYATKSDLNTKADKSSLADIATSGNYNDLSNKPDIPTAVTELTVSDWGFTKNTGTYSKPSTGIPKSDLASAVQTSLGKADTALQSYTEQYKGTVTGVKVNGSTKSPSSGTVDIGNVVTSVKINGSTKSPSSGVVDLGTVITSHQDISGKQDKLISGTNIKTINGKSIVGSGDITIGGVSEDYVDNAIAKAITTTLNTSV